VDDHQDETLAQGFRAVARTLRHNSREALAPLDVTPSHGRALGELAQHGVMRLNMLSEHLRIAPRSTTEVVDALEARGLVERRADPVDRRATLVALTLAGERLEQAIQTAREADASAFFTRLSSTDRTHLARILRKLRD
jgi:DNA-binding MarR family transcriptional regulator